MNARLLERAQLLLQQRRYADAEAELRKVLAENPHFSTAHALLSLTLGQMDRHDEAIAAAEAAVGLGPDEGFTHYVLAVAFDNKDMISDAEKAIKGAIEQDPMDEDFHALLSNIYFQQKRWPESLAAAEAGLKINAEHTQSANMRAMALVKLGRREEAGMTIDATLARNPENAVSHANRGWTLLESGDYQRAMEHFREALFLEPNLEWARQGIIEALKARNPVYRVMLKYFFWMSRLSNRAQWAVIIGLVFISRIVGAITESVPALEPFH